MTPYVSGSASIARRLLTGKSRCMLLGDSISVSLYNYWHKYWRNPIAGCNVIGGDCTFFASGTDFDAGTASLGTTGLIGSGNYSPFSTREVRFKGTTFGAVANSLSNRFLEGEDPGSRWASTKSANVFSNTDWTNTVSDLRFEALLYRNSTSCNTASGYIINGSTFAKIADLGQLTSLSTATPQHTLYTANFTAKPSGIRYVSEWQMPAGASVNNSHVVFATLILHSPSTTGLTLINNSYSGHSIGKWLLTSNVTQAAMTDAWGQLALDDVIIALSNNQPVVDGNGDPAAAGSFASAAQYQSLLTRLVTAIRTACPNAGITFLTTYDTNNAGSGAHLDGYNDANYAVQQATPNSCFVSGFRAGGAWTQINGASMLTDGTHPNALGCAYFLSRVELLMEELAATSGINAATHLSLGL